MLTEKQMLEIRADELRRTNRNVDPANGDAAADKGLRMYGTGATRSADADEVRYDLIPAGPLRRLAMRFATGAEKHGDSNWQKGLPPGVIYNHMIRHIELWRLGMDPGDDHLAAVAFGAVALMWYEERGHIMQDTADSFTADDVKVTL